MPRTPARRPDSSLPLGRRIGPGFKTWLVLDGEFLMGPRYLRLLEGIDETGTVRQACTRTGMSYRTCLSRIRAMERTLGAPVVTTARGGTARGGARLTPLGRRLLRLYERWRDDAGQAVQATFRRALR